MTHYSTIVLGGGAMGTAAAWQLGLRGERALVLEQFSHVHSMGAHSGQTRVFRHAYSEGADYVPFVLRADKLWVDLETETGCKTLHRVGTLEFDTGMDSVGAKKARETAIAHGVAYDWLNADEIRHRWPQFQIEDHWEAGYGVNAGFLDIEPALHAMGDSARAHGVEIRDNEPVLSWGANDSGVWVDSAQGRYTGDHLIITAGPWAWKVLAQVGISNHVLRKTLWWMEINNPEKYTTDQIPVYMADRPGMGLYGFPVFGQPGLKYANHQGGTLTDPDSVVRTTTDDEAEPLIAGGKWLFGDDAITGKVLSSAVCMYAMSPDGHFIIDRLPGYNNVVIGAGFSGHGFKFTTAVGEHLVNLTYDRETQPYKILAVDRFAAQSAAAS